MTKKTDYDIHTDIAFHGLDVFDVKQLVDACPNPWFNQTLCQVNDVDSRIGDAYRCSDTAVGDGLGDQRVLSSDSCTVSASQVPLALFPLHLLEEQTDLAYRGSGLRGHERRPR